MKSSLEIYRSEGETQIEVRFENETVWLSLNQISSMFGRDKSVVSRHLKNIYSSGELDQNSTVAKNATVQLEGGRQVIRDLEFYNLDVIISIGYRVNSKVGTHFRQWATQRLKDYLIKGYAVHQERLSQLQQSFQLIFEAALSNDFSKTQVKEIIDVLADYALGLDILDGYDKQNLERGMVQPNSIFQISYQEAKVAIEELRIKFGGSLLFGNEKDDSFKSSISTINQTFDIRNFIPASRKRQLIYFISW